MSDDMIARPKVTEAPRYKKLPGKKAGEMAVGVTGNEVARFELRVDTQAGTWIVVATDMMYTCSDKAILQSYMRELLRAQRKLNWTRYIVIDYEAEGPGSFGSRKRFTRKNREGGDYEVAGIRLDWEVFDISDPVKHPGQTKAMRKQRKVLSRGLVLDPNASNDADHDPIGYGYESWMRDDELPKGSVSFTSERHALLVEVRKALGQLDSRLAGVFASTGEALALRIDAMTANVLLLGDGEK